MNRLVLPLALLMPLAFSAAAQTKRPAASNAPLQASIAARGKAVYTQFCITCHQADGAGVQGINPPLIKTEYVLGEKAKLINIVLKGLNKELEIDGETYTNAMPPLNHLTDQQVADVLTYVRNNFSNKASAITATQVKAVRGHK